MVRSFVASVGIFGYGDALLRHLIVALTHEDVGIEQACLGNVNAAVGSSDFFLRHGEGRFAETAATDGSESRPYLSRRCAL